VTETGGTSGVVETGGVVESGGMETGGSGGDARTDRNWRRTGSAGASAPVETGAMRPRAELRNPAARVARRPRRKPTRPVAAVPAGSPGARPRTQPGWRCSGFLCSRFVFGRGASTTD